MSEPGTPSGCCAPRTASGAPSRAQIQPASDAQRPPSCEIPGGTALLGTAQAVIDADAESPLKKKRIAPFRMAETAVTNAQFARFIDATGYVTDAERLLWSFVFWSHVPEAVGATQAVAEAQWWRRVDGANWRYILGPGQDLAAARPDHPVVHVSWNDAAAYASWIGGRLPTEVEWEHAARGGQGDVRFPWGDVVPNDTDHFPCNIWQGKFPDQNTCADGYDSTAPARSFAPNAFGLYNLVGNVWEWSAEPFRIRSLKKAARLRQAQMQGYRLAKGGSFLCHRSYCYRYRIAARTGNSPDSTTTHMGFRVVWDV